MANEYDALGTGKFVTAEPDEDGVKLMAGGIEIPTDGSAESNVVVVIADVSKQEITMDKTYAEILEMLNMDKVVVIKTGNEMMHFSKYDPDGHYILFAHWNLDGDDLDSLSLVGAQYIAVESDNTIHYGTAWLPTSD